MVEGSQIDWAGHANDAEYILLETLDFDDAVGVGLDFAEHDGNTLVVVTADHETGGFAVLWLLTLYFYFRKPRLITQPQGINGTTSAGEKELLKQLQKACQKGDASLARRDLAQWTRNYAPQTMRGGIRDFGQTCGDAALQKAIAELDVYGFADAGTEAWKGDSLWATFRRWQRQADQPRNSEIGDSPKLYPG